MIPIYIRPELMKMVEENKTNVQNFLQRTTLGNVNVVQLELLLNNFRANANMNETFELLKDIKFNISNLSSLIQFGIDELRSRFTTTFLEELDSGALVSIRRNLVPSLNRVLGNEQLDQDSINTSRNLINIDENISNLIEETLYKNRVFNYPFVDLVTERGDKVKMIFIPLSILTKSYPYLIVNDPDNKSMPNYFKLFVETYIADITNKRTSNTDLSSQTTEYGILKKSIKILRNYYTIMKSIRPSI